MASAFCSTCGTGSVGICTGAHRLSTIQAADVIHVIDRGRVIQTGGHDSLLAAGGMYRDLYHEQFGDGAVETRCADGLVMANGDSVPDLREAASRENARLSLEAPRPGLTTRRPHAQQRVRPWSAAEARRGRH